MKIPFLNFRRTPPEPERPPINEDWRTGDWALCIDDNWASWPGAEPPKQGVAYLVLSAYPGRQAVGLKPCWGLRLAGVKPGRGLDGFTADQFRKVEPPAFEEPRHADDEICHVVDATRYLIGGILA